MRSPLNDDIFDLNMRDDKYILLVDDDPDDLMLLREAILSNGDHFSFHEAYDGKEALQILKDASAKKHLPCLVVLDINMPILDGKEILAIMKKDPFLKNIVVIIFTTSSNPIDINYCKEYNVPLFSKPYNITMLQEVAKQIVCYCND